MSSGISRSGGSILHSAKFHVAGRGRGSLHTDMIVCVGGVLGGIVVTNHKMSGKTRRGEDEMGT